MKKQNKLILIGLSVATLLTPLNSSALQKSETIYTNLNYDGTIVKTNVSNHLSFVDNGEIQDETELENILNIKGQEHFEIDKNRLLWAAQGRDIFYTGTTNKTTPIKTAITYYLDDEEMQVKDMIGKSGHVKIEYRFTNESKNILSINGHMEAIYTPFITITGTILDDDVKNVHITNGKLMNTGTRTIALGIASPGLYASTKISELSALDKITLSFDTEKFALGTTYIASTPKLLDNSAIGIFDKVDALSGNIGELETNMTKLTEEAQNLESGAIKLADGSHTLTTSIYKANTALDEIKNGSLALNVGIDNMINELTAAKTALANPQTAPSLQDIIVLRNMNDKAIENYINGFVQNGLDPVAIGTTCGTPSQSTDPNVQMFCLLNANNKALDSMLPLMVQKIDTVIARLNQIKEGTTKLSSGLSALDSGLDQIYAGLATLTAGTDNLKDGASSLKTGTIAFKEQGIDRLNETANKLITYSNRVESLVDLSKNYRGFTSNNSDEIVFVSMVKSCRR